MCTFIELSTQYFAVWIWSGKVIYFIHIEVYYTFNWTTPISILILTAFMIFRYVNFYYESKEFSKPIKIKSLWMEIFSDIKKLVLCLLFFYEDKWLLLITAPIILQVISLVVFLLWNKVKNNLTKAAWIINESTVIIFCICWIQNYSWFGLYSDVGGQVVSMVMEVSLIIILSIETLFIWVQDFSTIKK